MLKTLQQVPVTLRIKFKAHTILCKPCVSCPLDVPLLVGFTHLVSFSQSGFLAVH